jgi:hypothetical protein
MILVVPTGFTRFTEFSPLDSLPIPTYLSYCLSRARARKRGVFRAGLGVGGSRFYRKLSNRENPVNRVNRVKSA